MVSGFLLVSFLAPLQKSKLMFSAYPPSAPILSYLLTPLHPFLTPVLHLITSFLLSHLSTTYGQLVKDRMVLSAEVMREYDRRFVYKRIFGARVDRSVQTEQGQLVCNRFSCGLTCSRVFMVRQMKQGPIGTERVRVACDDDNRKRYAYN